MGGAKSQRRRAKLALEAQYGNLYKAQFGKASKHDRLPEPPTSKQLQPQLSRNFKKMRALMELTKPDSAGRKRASEHDDTNKGAKRQKRKEQDGKAPPLAVNAAVDADQLRPGAEDGAADRPAGGRADAHTAKALPLVVANPFENTAASKTKLKRKEVLNQKKKLKRLRKQVAQLGGAGPKKKQKDDEDNDFKLDPVEFGEVSAAPPRVNLKRRHWDPEQTELAHKSRNKDMMLKFMSEADRRLKSQSTVAADQSQRAKVQQQELMRQALVDAYRDQKKHGSQGQAAPSRPGTATLQSLKTLVQTKTS